VLRVSSPSRADCSRSSREAVKSIREWLGHYVLHMLLHKHEAACVLGEINEQYVSFVDLPGRDEI
jgi:hypothetical protein